MVQQAMSGSWTAYDAQLFCFTVFVLVSRVHGCCSVNSEGQALLQFRDKVEFDPSGALATWNSDHCNYCDWSGVRCLDGNVYALDLNGRDLKGELAPELGNLSRLRVLDLSRNHLSGTIPQEFGHLTSLEVLDLRNNKFTGTVPTELGRLRSLKRLLLSNNRFDGRIPVEIGKLSLLTDLRCDETLTTAKAGIGCGNRKLGHCIWQSVIKQSQKSNSFQVPLKGTILHYLNLFPLYKFGSKSSRNQLDDIVIDTNLTDNRSSSLRRVLVEQSSNLIAIPPDVQIPVLLDPNVAVPSRSSGSFPAVPSTKKSSPLVPSPASLPSPEEHKMHDSSPETVNEKRVESILLCVLAFWLIVAAAVIVICRSRAAKTIRPWKTGLSGQLQKAFVTGVPKLNRDELETACEDFSNIIITDERAATVYKGTLSSGVEIAVVSTALTDKKDWSKRSELVYRNKIASLSRLNHKNFLNLIGYCEEEQPFTRMMVFEYAPNGNFFEHLHDQEFEHLDWSARTRIIMGTAYCLQHMHEMNPPVPTFSLTSKDIILTDDYAAKIADLYFWAEMVINSIKDTENETEKFKLPPPGDVESNVYSFGIFLLETISGKLPYSEEQGPLIDWAAPYLNDRKFSSLIDPTLKAFNKNELEVICDAIQSCTEQDAKKRPCMTEVVQILKRAIGISPEAAAPRLSPLWWAELEILSAETA